MATAASTAKPSATEIKLVRTQSSAWDWDYVHGPAYDMLSAFALVCAARGAPAAQRDLRVHRHSGLASGVQGERVGQGARRTAPGASTISAEASKQAWAAAGVHEL